MGIGNVVIDVIRNVYPTLPDKPHFYLTMPPEYWNHNFDEMICKKDTIKFLCGFPISEQEYQMIKDNGQDYFEVYLEENDIDFLILRGMRKLSNKQSK